MSDDSGKTKKLSLSGSKLTLGAIDASKLRTGTAVGAGRKTVQVEVRRKRAPAAPSRTPAAAEAPPAATASTTPAANSAATGGATAEQMAPSADDRLTAQERAARVRALQEGLKKPAAETVSGDAVPGDVSVASSDDNDSTSVRHEGATKTACFSMLECIPLFPVLTLSTMIYCEDTNGQLFVLLCRYFDKCC